MFQPLVAFAMLMTLKGENGQIQKNPLEENYRCNYARVRELKPGRHLTVRSRPGIKSKKIDRLSAGKNTYICNETQDWFEVFYSDRDGACYAPSSRGLDEQKAKSCQSGWVSKQWIDVISG
jgi:hypothetical protein